MINLSTFFTSLGITGGNTQATNFYDFWYGIQFSDGTITYNITDFMTYLGTNRYEFFHSLESTYPNVFNEYTFYSNIDDPRIYDFKTFYTYGGEYLGGIPVTPTPTPTNTPTRTPTPTPTQSPYPVCPQEITETNSEYPTFDGTYQYFGIGYLDINDNIVLESLDGVSYIIYKQTTTNKYIIFSELNMGQRWRNWDTIQNVPLHNVTISSGGISYPGQGTTSSGAYLVYPAICPSPTPTPTNTPTRTPTPTPTPSSSPTAVSIGYRTSFEDPANASAYTFNSLSTGGAGLIAISFSWEGASGVVSNVTIGGTTATLAYQDNQPGPGVATYYAFTTASTVNVSITFTAQQLRIIGGMWRITGYVSSTPTATAIGVSGEGVPTSASTITITGITNNSVVIALQSNGTQSTPVTWTGATERFDLDTDTLLRASGADASGTSTSLTISTTYPTSTQRTKLLGVAWR